MTSLELHNVSHRFGAAEVLREVSLQVSRGEVHCLLGPSGSGKSTLLRLVAGLETLQQGRIDIDSTEVAGAHHHLPPEQRRVGFVFQDYALFPHLDVRRNVLFGMPPGPSHQRNQAVIDLLERVEMVRFAGAMPHTLSGGEQQRVALARALARRPQVMLLDEPFSGLDRSLRRAVRSNTLAVLKEAGVATLMVTHDPREARLVADRLSVLHGGEILQSGPPLDLYHRPSSLPVAELFGPINRVSGIVKGRSVEVPWGVVDARDETEGAAVVVLLRPEWIWLDDADGFRAEPAAEIAGITADGPLVRVTVRCADGTLLSLADVPRHAWTVGQSVVVRTIDDPPVIRSDSDRP